MYHAVNVSSRGLASDRTNFARSGASRVFLVALLAALLAAIAPAGSFADELSEASIEDAGLVAEPLDVRLQKNLVEARSGRSKEALAGAVVAKATPACSGGTVVDDNSFENGYRPASVFGPGEMVMRLDPPPDTNSIEQLCLCWTSLGDDFALHDLVIYDDDGPGGEPGTEVARIPAITDGIPAFTRAFFSYDLSDRLIALPPGPLYLGMGDWSGAVNPDIFLCADETGEPKAPMYTTTAAGPGWGSVPDSFPDASALGIRADFFDLACIPGGDTMCLGEDLRFKLSVTWRDFDGNTGTGTLREIGLRDSGLFWFFGPQNMEILVKVLDACTLNERFWVFMAATTSVEYTLSVEDTKTGVVKTYFNPLGNAAAAVTDTSAFATCSD